LSRPISATAAPKRSAFPVAIAGSAPGDDPADPVCEPGFRPLDRGPHRVVLGVTAPAWVGVGAHEQEPPVVGDGVAGNHRRHGPLAVGGAVGGEPCGGVARVEHEPARLEGRDADARAPAAAERRGALADAGSFPWAAATAASVAAASWVPLPSPAWRRARLVDRDLGAIDAEQVGGGGGVLADVVAGG